MSSRSRAGTPGEVARVFTRLGITAFGGPAAHVAAMHEELVTRRGWLVETEFLDLLAATNLLPGPNSTELAIHLGYRRAGWRGLVVAGAAFILPAALLVGVLAWLYATYGRTAPAEGVLYGLKPVVIAVVVQALVRLARTSLRDPLTIAVAAAATGAYLGGVHELAVLGVGGLLPAAARTAGGVRLLLPLAWPLVAVATTVPVGLGRLAWVFLKVGALLYGSGYVLLAFLRSDLVVRLGWLSEQQLLDAVAAGQVTPGPVFATATFVGYLVAGLPGAVLATVGIFLPAFLLVAVADPVVRRVRSSPRAAAFLDGVVAAALGLMAGVTLLLARDAMVDLTTATIALAGSMLLVATRLPVVWLLVAGAGVGLLVGLVR